MIIRPSVASFLPDSAGSRYASRLESKGARNHSMAPAEPTSYVHSASPDAASSNTRILSALIQVGSSKDHDEGSVASTIKVASLPSTDAT